VLPADDLVALGLFIGRVDQRSHFLGIDFPTNRGHVAQFRLALLGSDLLVEFPSEFGLA